jgi:hypothetical protein
MAQSLEGDSDKRNTHSENFAGGRKVPLTWRHVFSAALALVSVLT